jgi:L-alanine-DL-glutamate epimerase-like enolase superfamily enzyme
VDIQTSLQHWPLKAPFSIAGHTFEGSDVLVVKIRRGGLTGWGETTAPYYKAETLTQVQEQVASVAAARSHLQRRDLDSLPIGAAAKNAVDCALWDLEAQHSGRPVWELLKLRPPRPLQSTYTVSAGAPREMADEARRLCDATHLKLKLTGCLDDDERVQAVRAARPDVWLMVDANQGFTLARFQVLLPVLVDSRVALIEQPLPVGEERQLRELRCPIPIAADESVQSIDDIAPLVGLCQVINIKLEKCGGLTQALAMVRESRALGFKVMIGNMMGTSLSLAPAYLVGQLCDYVDLDAGLFLSGDREPPVTYSRGIVTCPAGLWGQPAARPASNQIRP